ncbi:isochorismatase family protein [Candidatus Shapirobacteria bacterium]|nr:isochorismatase family protein [Candidatus Shapirobacteria bacterium]
MQRALLIVDTQNDFCPGGGFPVPEGNKIIGPLNKVLDYARNRHWKIFASRDWHASNLFSKDDCSRHCIQETKGAKFHPDLKIKDDVIVISKGSHDLSDRHYSAFNGDEISLDELLRETGVKELYIGGLALDYCVKNTAIDSAKKGYKTYVFLDATKAVNNKSDDIKATVREMKKEGIEFIKTAEFLTKNQ